MLVLSRGLNEKVVFPTLGITVDILRLAGSKVRLGIDAPKNIPVLREEIANNGGGGQAVTARADKTSKDRLTHATRNRLQKATLGLRLVQRMLEAGQANDIEPTIFKIFNELKSLEDELAWPSEQTPSAKQLRQQPSHCRALVVEDDANECELLAGYLRLTGFQVDTAADGLQAMVRLAKPERPDIVLLDMKMPRFDGSKTVSAIRQNPDYRALKIFAVTGTDQGDAAVKVGPEGVDRWFRKPVDPEQLVTAIHSELHADLATA
jgi:carbon storage regulator CsrA